MIIYRSRVRRAPSGSDSVMPGIYEKPLLEKYREGYFPYHFSITKRTETTERSFFRSKKKSEVEVLLDCLIWTTDLSLVILKLEDYYPRNYGHCVDFLTLESLTPEVVKSLPKFIFVTNFNQSEILSRDKDDYVYDQFKNEEYFEGGVRLITYGMYFDKLHSPERQEVLPFIELPYDDEVNPEPLSSLWS